MRSGLNRFLVFVELLEVVRFRFKVEDDGVTSALTVETVDDGDTTGSILKSQMVMDSRSHG